MNPMNERFARIRKAIAGAVTGAAASAGALFGANAAAFQDEYAWLITVVSTVIAGVVVWLVPNRPKGVQSSWFASIAIMALLFILAGCASQQAETSAQRVFALQADYNALLALAVAYESQPRCGPGERLGCSKPAVVAEIRRADDHAFDAIRTAQNLVRSPNARDSPVKLALAGAIEAVGLIRRILEREGIR